jgi:hypothetical protein
VTPLASHKEPKYLIYHGTVRSVERSTCRHTRFTILPIAARHLWEFDSVSVVTVGSAISPAAYSYCRR